ncbi:MAG: ABC transporter family substrate-binding protein [Actinomycetota bacterium]|nr:ABC transporter family substrate-binding protein [Actinomycetota bacterium]
MRRSSALFLVSGLFVAQIFIPTRGSAQSVEPQSGGRVVVAAEQEAADGFHHWLICCTLQWSMWMVDNLLPDAYRRTPDFTFAPEVLAEEAEVTLDPFAVTYRIRDEAIWNDGVPVGARDFVFTWRAFVDPDNQMWSREGYELISDATVIDDKTVRFEFRRVYPEYKLLFQDVFPRHVLKDKNLNRAWARQIPISGGPFEFKEYVRGSHLTLVRNDDYWGSHPAYLDEVEFRFIPEVDMQLEALRKGEVDLIYPSLEPELADVHSFPEVEVQNSPGLLWEHVDMSFRDDRLKRPFVRRAIATAIDRETIVEQVIRPIDPDSVVAQNLIFGVEEPGYEEHFGMYTGDAAAARQILEDHGCEDGPDGIYVCAGERLTFTYHTTAGNPIRKDVAEMIRAQLDAAGIELEVRRRDPSILFGNRILVQVRYDLIQYAWVHDELSFDRQIWSCKGGSNFTRYCNPDVDALLLEAVRELDDDRRFTLANAADEVMARDLVALPLYQRPTFLAYSADIQGVVDNPTPEGFTWNIQEWWREV